MAKKKMTIGKRIGIGFTLTLSLTLAVGTAGYWGMNRLSHAMKLNQEANLIQFIFSKTQTELTRYMLNSFDEAFEEQRAAKSELDTALQDIVTHIEKLRPQMKMIPDGERRYADRA